MQSSANLSTKPLWLGATTGAYAPSTSRVSNLLAC